jgi:putative Mn2+ efflux pump MntP
LSNSSKTSDVNQIILQIVNEKKPQTVKQLIHFVNERLHLPDIEILHIIIDLQTKGKISLKETPLQPSTTLASYMKTTTALWYWGTIITAAVTALIVFTVPENLYPISYIRIALGTIFIFWLPGYTITKALFPQRMPVIIKSDTKNLDNIERIALSLGISIAIVPIVGLLLNYTPWGIRLTPIVLSLLALALIFATVAIVREYKLQTETKHYNV